MNGVIYQLTGKPAAPLLMVSMTALRRLYQGPVAIAVSRECYGYAELAAKYFGDVELIPTYLLPQCSRPHFTAKAFTYLLSPFDRSVYLDADTVPIKPIDQLFEINKPLAVPKMGDHGLAGNSNISKFFREKMERPFRQYGPVCERMLTSAIESDVPIVNSGVVSYDHRAHIMHIVHGLTMAGRRGNVDDEMVIQIAAGQFPDDVEVLGQEWNHTTKYGGNADTARILHFHRKSWSGVGLEQYLPFWEDACSKTNVSRWAKDCSNLFERL